MSPNGTALTLLGSTRNADADLTTRLPMVNFRRQGLMLQFEVHQIAVRQRAALGVGRRRSARLCRDRGRTRGGEMVPIMQLEHSRLPASSVKHISAFALLLAPLNASASGSLSS